MIKQIKSTLGVAGLSLMLAVPAYAHTAAATDNGNGGLGNGMGTFRSGTQHRMGTYQSGTTYTGTTYSTKGTGKAPNYGVSVYGTGTGSQYWHTNSNTEVAGTGRVGTNNYTGYGANTNMDGRNIDGRYTDGRYRTTAAATTRSYNWGWLGLLGLIGLAGMRSRNPEGGRR